MMDWGNSKILHTHLKNGALQGTNVIIKDGLELLEGYNTVNYYKNIVLNKLKVVKYVYNNYLLSYYLDGMNTPFLETMFNLIIEEKKSFNLLNEFNKVGKNLLSKKILTANTIAIKAGIILIESFIPSFVIDRCSMSY